MRQAAIAVLLVCLSAVAACGYSFGGDSRPAVPEGSRRLFLTEVDNPTAENWLGPDLRGALRDELNRRGIITWADDRATANGYLSLTILRYARRTAVSGANDQSLRYDATLEIEAVIRSAYDGSIQWSSGLITVTEPYFGGQEAAVDAEVVRQASRRIAERMSLDF